MNSENEISIQTINLLQLVNEVLVQFRDQLTELGIHTSVKINQHVKFRADTNLLRIPITNIIGNAIQFCDPHKSEKQITIQGNISFNSCSIAIIDNGIGIRKEQVINIFEPFFRGSEKSQGSGMGLYVAREVLEKMGGGIMVESREDQGTKFIIWIPNSEDTPVTNDQ